MAAHRDDEPATTRILDYRAALAGSVAALGLSLLGDPDAASAAVPSGTEFQVNTYTTNNQVFPSVASDSAGNFVVVWQSRGSAGSDTDGYSVQGQLPEPSFVPSLGAMFAMAVALARRRQRT